MASYTKIYPTSWFNTPNDPPWIIPGTFQGSWTVNPSGSPSRASLVGYVAGADNNFASVTEAVSTTGLTYGIYRWTSAPMLAGTTAGTVDMVMGVRESDAAAGFTTKVYIYITVGATDAVRGVVLDFTDTDEWPTTAEGFDFSSPQAVGSVAYQDGDRLVIEFGYAAGNASATPYEGRVWAGGFWDDSDLTVGSLNVTAERGFFEFSTALNFDEPTPQSGDIIAGNEEFYFFNHDTGALERIVIESSTNGSNVDPANGLQLSTGTWVFPLQPPSSLSADGELAFYNSAFVLQDIVNLNPGTRPHSVTLDTSDNIYVGFRGNSNSAPSDATSAVQKLDSAGVFVDSYNVARDGGCGASSIDLAADGETLYYVNRGRIVYRYNVATDTQLANLVTLPTEVGPTYSTSAKAYGIRLLPNDEALVADLIDIKRISTVDGTILQRYAYANVEDWQHVSIGVGATTFTSATLGAPDTSASTNLKGASGPNTPLAVKWDLDTGTALFGLFQDVDPDTGGSQRGITTTDGWTPVDEDASTGTIIVTKIVCPSTNTTEFEFTAGGGLSPGTFTLGHNDSQSFLGVTAGSGYSIEETTVDPNFLPPIYTVSNGSPIDNITVAAAEIVTVTVKNRLLVTPDFEVEDDPIRWLRRSPIQASENRNVFWDMFSLEIDPGVGQPSGDDQDTDPQVMMRFSQDNGKTWGNEMWRSMGRVGKWQQILQWWGLGKARNMVIEVSGSAAVHTVLIDGYAQVSPSTESPTS